MPGLSGVIDIAAGGEHTCALNQDGVWCWGNNVQGQLGGGDEAFTYEPVMAEGLEDGVTDVDAASNNSCAIKDGGAWCWGNNSLGQLGGNDLDICHGGGYNQPCSLQPIHLAAFGQITVISTGGSHMCAVKDGALLCIGSDSLGQLGGLSLDECEVGPPGFRRLEPCSLVPIEVFGFVGP